MTTCIICGREMWCDPPKGRRPEHKMCALKMNMAVDKTDLLTEDHLAEVGL